MTQTTAYMYIQRIYYTLIRDMQKPVNLFVIEKGASQFAKFNCQIYAKISAENGKFVDLARYNAKNLTRDKYDRLAIKYLKFEKSRRKSTVTNKTSDTKRYKNILSHSIASKQTT